MSPALEVSEGHAVQRILLNRPSTLNAYDPETARQLLEAIERAAERVDVGAVVLQGNGPFCVGHDFNHFWRLFREGDVESYRRLQETLRALHLALRKMPQLVIAVIEGTAAGGGCTLALAADCRIAGAEATFGHPAVEYGFPAEIGAAAMLATTGGASLALEMLATGRLLDASEATRRGLAELHDDPARAGRQLARRAAEASGEQRRRLKRSVYRPLPFPTVEDFDREIEERVRFFLSDECAEAFARLEEAGARPDAG